MIEREETVREEDGGSSNDEPPQASTIGPSHVANDEAGNGEDTTSVQPEEDIGTEKKSKKKKKKKKRKKHRTDSNDENTKESKPPRESNGVRRARGAPTQTSKRKRNGRLVRLVSIDVKTSDSDLHPSATFSEPETTSVPPLPRNQYTTTLRRRAIRKQDDNSPHDSDDYGDVSLGIKLIVAGGRVIVQSLNSLSDGLASPAQLAGVIQRGDVLLAIGNLSLANLPIHQLMEGLRPLSTPDAGGFYEPCLDLRFEAGAGLALLTNHEKEQEKLQNNVDAEAMYTMFPMVDQLSGAPLFVPEINPDVYRDGLLMEENQDRDAVRTVEEAKGEDITLSDRTKLDEVLDKFSLDLDSLISAVLAKERNSDRDRYESAYFDLKEDISALLRSNMITEESQEANRSRILSKVERLEMGRKIMRIIKALEMNIEEIDKGRDARTFKTWSSGLSVGSGYSSVFKRQYNTDGTITSFPSYNSPFDTTLDDDSIGSDDSIDDVDADKLLLGLAARDIIWRELVITALDKAADDITNNGETSSQNGGIDLRQQLGSFLFRGVPKRKVTSVAFPPQEITRVLFNLATFIATTAHDDITTFGGSSKISSRRSVATNGTIGRRASVRGDFVLAKQFILEEAIPHWLKSFQPLTLDQRMVLWPGQSDRIENNGDNMTAVGSEGSVSGTQKQKRGWKDADYDFSDEHDEDLRSETCFLLTYYCTEKIIGSERAEDSTSNGNSFILTFGAYLQIHTCLSFASFVKDETTISDVLRVANDDPNHRDVLKEIRDSNKPLFYDSTKLSAVLQCLEGIRYERDEDKRKVLLDLCVSGYPDVQPWQVHQACLAKPQSNADDKTSCSDATMEDEYYKYLCQLLNPVDGHEAAREDSDLLKEFCFWSIGVGPNGENIASRIENFLNIASPSSEFHTRYSRDLIMLLDFSLTIENNALSLDLVNEIIDDRKLSSSFESLRRCLLCLRKIGRVSIGLCSNPSTKTLGFETLQRVLMLFEKISEENSLSINVPDEIYSLLQQWKSRTASSGDDATMYELIDFVIDVSTEPANVIKALSLRCKDHGDDSLLPRLEHLLRRGIHFAVIHGELSGTLLRLKHARTAFDDLDLNRDQALQTKDTASIWESMGKGNASIEK